MKPSPWKGVQLLPTGSHLGSVRLWLRCEHARTHWQQIHVHIHTFRWHFHYWQKKKKVKSAELSKLLFIYAGLVVAPVRFCKTWADLWAGVPPELGWINTSTNLVFPSTFWLHWQPRRCVSASLRLTQLAQDQQHTHTHTNLPNIQRKLEFCAHLTDFKADSFNCCYKSVILHTFDPTNKRFLKPANLCKFLTHDLNTSPQPWATQQRDMLLLKSTIISNAKLLTQWMINQSNYCHTIKC